MNKLENISEFFLCPKCKKNALEFLKNIYKCKNCNKEITIQKNKVIFSNVFFKEKSWVEKSKNFNTLNYGKYLIEQINGPKISELPKIYSPKGININLGSGNNNFDNYINIDLGNYEDVDIICDLTEIPLKNESVDLIACNSVFEHLQSPFKVKDEVTRILKKGGIFYLCVPFMCIRHHEIDFVRWTSYGLIKFLKDDFEIIEAGPCRSPAQGLISYFHAFIDLYIKNKILKKISFFIWKIISLPLYFIKVDKSEETLSLSQTIYVLCKKK